MFYTVIIPTYNREGLIEEAILSVIKQACVEEHDYEIIVVDDGSTDGTQQVMDKLREISKGRLRYFYKKNWGVWSARNLGIEKVSPDSDCIIFLDSDDKLHKDLFLNIAVAWNWEFHDIPWLAFPCVDQDGGKIGSYHSVSKKYAYRDFIGAYGVIPETIYAFRSWIFRHGHFRFEEDINTESVLWYKIAKWLNDKWNRYVVGFIEKVGRIYRRDSFGGQITTTVSRDRFKRNAIGNERILQVIWDDLLLDGFLEKYAELCMRAGLNWILFGNKDRGFYWLRNGLVYNKSTRNLVLFGLSWLSPQWLLWLYKFYINR